jgi:hypothetical protein
MLDDEVRAAHDTGVPLGRDHLALGSRAKVPDWGIPELTPT